MKKKLPVILIILGTIFISSCSVFYDNMCPAYAQNEIEENEQSAG